MRNMQQSVCKAGNANVLQSYDNQVPRDVCLKVVSGCLFESAIAADRRVCVCVGGCSVEKKNCLFHVLPTRGPLVLTCLRMLKIMPFDSGFSEICRETDLRKHLYLCFLFYPHVTIQGMKKT